MGNTMSLYDRLSDDELDLLEDALENEYEEFEKMYKIFEVDDDDNIKTLFHGIDGTKIVPKNKVWVADEKMVRDGSKGPMYLSGFHVLPTEEDCVNYMKRFSSRLDKLRIVPVKVRKLRPKKHSNSPVLLASEMILEA